MSAGNSFYSYIIIPATVYIQLQIIKHINHQFVFLHTCTQTLFHTQHSREMQEIFRRAHNNKRQYFIEPFLIRSVSCKRDHVWRCFLSRPIVLSRLTTAVVVFYLAEKAGMRYNFKLKPLLHWFRRPTSQQDNILSSLCRRSCAVLNWPSPFLALFCLQLALWRNCDIGAKTVYSYYEAKSLVCARNWTLIPVIYSEFACLYRSKCQISWRN